MESTDKHTAAPASGRFVDNGNGAVTDLRQRVMWMQRDSWLDLGRFITWSEAQEYARAKNAEKFAGFTGWRLPTAKEAKNLFEDGKETPDKDGCPIHIDPVFAAGGGFTTWTSELRAAKQAMGFDFRSDFEYWADKTHNAGLGSVRLTRDLAAAPKTSAAGGDANPSRFADNGDGTISDLELGLMWKKADSFLDLDKWVSYEEGKTYVSELNRRRFAGHADWRVPSKTEALSIFQRAHANTDTYNNTIYIPAVFTPGAGETTWTRTVHKTDKSLVMRVFYYNGDHKWHKRGLRSHGVRAVRSCGGQSAED